VPVVDIVRVSGLLSIPLVYLSLLGFIKILGFRFFERKSQILFWVTGTANVIAIILFTQVWPNYYILMMIAGGPFRWLGCTCTDDSQNGELREARRRIFPNRRVHIPT